MASFSMPLLISKGYRWLSTSYTKLFGIPWQSYSAPLTGAYCSSIRRVLMDKTISLRAFLSWLRANNAKPLAFSKAYGLFSQHCTASRTPPLGTLISHSSTTITRLYLLWSVKTNWTGLLALRVVMALEAKRDAITWFTSQRGVCPPCLNMVDFKTNSISSTVLTSIFIPFEDSLYKSQILRRFVMALPFRPIPSLPIMRSFTREIASCTLDSATCAVTSSVRLCHIKHDPTLRANRWRTSLLISGAGHTLLTSIFFGLTTCRALRRLHSSIISFTGEPCNYL
jgi:hypothetical protein